MISVVSQTFPLADANGLLKIHYESTKPCQQLSQSPPTSSIHIICVELLLFFKEKAKQSFCFSCFKSKIWKATFQRRSLRFWLCCKKNEENSFVMEKAPGQAESKQFSWKEIKAVWKCFPLSVLKGDRKFHGNNILQHFSKEHIYKYFFVTFMSQFLIPLNTFCRCD